MSDDPRQLQKIQCTPNTIPRHQNHFECTQSTPKARPPGGRLDEPRVQQPRVVPLELRQRVHVLLVARAVEARLGVLAEALAEERLEPLVGPA